MKRDKVELFDLDIKIFKVCLFKMFDKFVQGHSLNPSRTRCFEVYWSENFWSTFHDSVGSGFVFCFNHPKYLVCLSL